MTPRPLPNIRAQDAARYHSQVGRRGEDECWPWIGAQARGYGAFALGGRSVKAHRVAFALDRGTLNDALLVCHTCDNPPCQNPRHLFQGDHLVNQRDCKAKGRGRSGERNGRAKITRKVADEIRADGSPCRKVAVKYGLSKSAVNYIQAGRLWP